MAFFGRKQAQFSEPAAWWNARNNQEKILFILGFYSAMQEFNLMVMSVAETPSEVFAGTATNAEMVRTLFQATANLCDYSEISPVELAAHLTAFYPESANKLIPYAPALQLLRGRLAGESDEKVADDLQRLRRVHSTQG